MNWEEQSVLVTGATGSFGQRFIKFLLDHHPPRRLIIFSRDELKQHEMRTAGFDDPRLRYFIGDVRDLERLRRALHGVDVAVHAAALKQVPACEYNPIEAVNTNILGARNLIEASLDMGVERVMSLSTDKAVNPTNLYGATKLVAEKLVVQANAYRGDGPTKFSCVRYGNVIGSRGSVIPLFQRQRETGTVTITDERMTRFWITLEQGVRFVVKCIEVMQGGEVFVPKIPSMKLTDLADAIAPGCSHRVTGIRAGEKLNEILLSEDEARQAIELEDMFVIEPAHPWWESGKPRGKTPPEGFRYTSDLNDEWLSAEALHALLEHG